MKLSRREFFVASGLFALSAARVKASEKQSVIVLGAGLAGLSSALQLAELGHDVTVLEARNRVGGRIFTLRKPFSEGLYTEVGGELVGDGYKRFLKYAHRFKLPYVELRAEAETGGSVAEIQDGIGRNAYMKGRFYRKGAIIQKHPYRLNREEARMLPQTLLGRQLRLIGNDLRRGKTTLEELDRMSLAKALSKNGVSKRAIRLIDISLNYNSIDTVSAGGVMQDVERRRSAGTVPLRLKGGNDSFVNALGEAATEAGARISLNSRVESISQNTRDVKIRYIGPKGELKTIVADRVVCSLPFSVLQGISVTPGLSFGKSSAINEVAYTRSTKVFFQAKYAEWDKRSLGSSVWTDTPLERIFSSTGRLGDEKALFTAWAEGDGSKVLESMPDVERRRYAAAEFVKILPFMKDSIEKTHSHSWTLDPFARGAYFHYKVGQLNRFQDLMHKPAGRLHFAGEHTAITMPGMEGALESADRVVEEISGVPVKV